MKNRRFLLLSFIALLISSGLTAQNEMLLLRGSLKDEATLKKLDGVQIIVFQNGSQFDVIDAGTSGKIQVEVPLGYSYDFKFNKDGYISKILRFDTRNIPAEDKAGGFQVDLNLNMFAMIEGFNLDIMKEPIGLANFNDQENNILFDFKYTERQQAKINAEKERLKKLDQEGDAMKKEYDKLMAEGDQKMIEKEFQEAMAKYDGALKLFPQDQPAKTKYAEAKAKYDEMMAAKKREEDYKRLIAEGDAHFAAKKWNEAKKSFTDASNLKKEEKYPKEKLYEISKMLDQEALRKEFDAIVAEADTKYNNKDYAVSIEKYREALKILPNETYPKDQIAKAQTAIDAMLADEAKRKQLQQRYDDLITLGNKNIGEKKYDAALTNFEEASNLMPAEKLPKEKIAEIEKILRDLRSKEEQDALARDNAEKERIDREYNQHILAADKFYTDSKEKNIGLLESAKQEYTLASGIKPLEKYPTAKIKSIDELIARIRAEESLAADAESKNAERLRQEEELRKKREEAERLAAEQRKALEEEEARKRREREAAQAAEEEARRNRSEFLKVDNAEEETAEAFFREAKRREEEAKAKAMQEKKDQYTAQVLEQQGRAEDSRREQLDNINSQKDKLNSIYRTGDSWQSRSVTEMEAEKDQDDKNKAQYQQRAQVRSDRAAQESQNKKENQDKLSANDRYRQQSTEKVQAKQEVYREADELNRSKGDTRIAANTAQVDRRKEDVADMARDGEQVRQLNIEDATEKKETASARERDVRSAADVRLNSSEGNVELEKQRALRVGEGKENLQEEEIMEIDRQKQNAVMMSIEKEQDANTRRHATREELYDRDSGSEKTDDEYKAPAGTENLPEGVTETSYNFEKPDRKVIERIVKRGNKVDTYRKVVSKTGVYYFKNNRSITEEIWTRETLKAE
jgi:hypothetical protein